MLLLSALAQHDVGLSTVVDDVACVLDVELLAPLPDVTLHRAQLRLSGSARRVPASEAVPLLASRCAAVDFASAYRTWPEPRLLVLDVVAAELHRGLGCHALSEP